MICLHTKVLMPSSSGSLVTAVKTKTEYSPHTFATFFLTFYKTVP